MNLFAAGDMPGADSEPSGIVEVQKMMQWSAALELPFQLERKKPFS